MIVPGGLPLVAGPVLVRALAQEDAPAVQAIVGPGELPAWGPVAGPYTAEEADELVKVWRLLAGQLSLVIVHEGRLVGGIAAVLDGPGSAELGYWIVPGLRGRGIATQAVAMVAVWAPRAMRLRRLWLEIDHGNAASLRVAERAGFTRAGDEGPRSIWEFPTR